VWLIALRGLRRGEAAALDRDDLDSEARELTISRQLIALPGEPYCGPPKSRASHRTIALDEAGTRRLVDQAVRQTVELLRHQFTEQRRSDSRARTGPGWRQGRALFTYADGRPIRPEYPTHRFHVLIQELDLPPIRLRPCDPHPGRGHRVRLPPDVSSRSSKPGNARDLGSSRGRAAITSAPARDPGMPHPCPTTTKAV